MSVFKRSSRIAVAAFVVAAGVGGTAAIARPLTATAATTYACEFTGTTTSLTPIAPVPKKGGSGSYTFSGSATCLAGTKKMTVGISSSGTYVNTVCGTGTAIGSASFTGGLPSFNYKISFYAGVGNLTVTSGATGNGAVDIVPGNTGGCVTVPVTKFTVRGATKVTG